MAGSVLRNSDSRQNNAGIILESLIVENLGCRSESERIREILRNRHYSRIIPLTGIEVVRGMSRVPLVQTEMRLPEDESSASNRVILEVGLPGDTWKYSVDRQSLAEKSEWFRAMLVGPFAPPPSDPPPTVALSHVDKRAFDNLLSYFRGESVKFTGVTTARATLDIAHYYLCPELAKMAVDYLIKKIDASSVLAVYHGLHLYAHGDLDAGERTPSAPPGDDASEIAMACTRLLVACLAVIDVFPDDVLRQESFEELTKEEVASLARRDDLKLTKESVLFDALNKWAASDCRSRGVELTAFNKRNALSDDIWYSVRYLLMDDKEFIEGPMASGLLSSAESAIIVARILGHQQERENQTFQNQNIPYRLSTTPRSRKSPVKKNQMKNKSKNTGMKPGKKECEDNKKNRRKECASQSQRACSRVGDLVVRVLACVFD